MPTPEQYVVVPGEPHSATIAFEPSHLGDFAGVLNANVRVIPSFDPSRPDESDILSRSLCDLEHFATPAGVTGLRARSEGDRLQVQYDRIVTSIASLITELNDIVNETGDWGPRPLEL